MDRLNESKDTGPDPAFPDAHSPAPASAAEVFHIYGERVLSYSA